MKTIIAGSRDCFDTVALLEAIRESQFTITVVVSGTAKGVDQLGEAWAKANGIRIKKFRPDWDRYGLSAGPIRNREMAEYAEALIALWDGKSKGTKNMIDEARKRGLKVFIYDPKLGLQYTEGQE